MAKVSSFRSNEVQLSCDEPTIKNFSEFWVVQFVGAPGIKIHTKNGIETITNKHYICPYRKFDFGWGVDPWRGKFLVEEFDFENGLVHADGITKPLIFFVAENFEK